jgi:hypothetical protein
MSVDDRPPGGGARPHVRFSDAGAEVGELRRRARQQRSRLVALLARVDELEDQIRKHFQYLARQRRDSTSSRAGPRPG